MGTDIHCFLEQQDIDYQWSFVKEIDIRRNYALFGCLYDGIRRWNGFCKIPMRGLPDNLSSTTLNHLYDDHSHNFIFTYELPIVKTSFIEAITVAYNDSVEQAKRAFETFGKDGQSFDEFWSDVYGVSLDDIINQRFVEFSELFSLEMSTELRLVYWFDN